jgi:hypothetical protein
MAGKGSCGDLCIGERVVLLSLDMESAGLDVEGTACFLIVYISFYLHI